MKDIRRPGRCQKFMAAMTKLRLISEEHAKVATDAAGVVGVLTKLPKVGGRKLLPRSW